MVRPLSQTGLRRVPSNPNQRWFIEGGVPFKREALDRANDHLAEEGRTLHPTKGFRKLSVKRSVAARIAAEISAGMMPFSMKKMRQDLRQV